MSKRTVLTLLLCTLAFAACGKSTPTGTGGSVGNTIGNSNGCDVATVTGAAGSKPSVKLNEGCQASSELVTKDVITGNGAEAKSGSQITVQYLGIGLKTKKEFDTSWGKQPFPLTLGAGAVIKGWDRGIVGMKKGGRRLLVIPPDLAYGANGFPPVIEANETLVFVVDLLEVK